MKQFILPPVFLLVMCLPAEAQTGSVWSGWLGAIGAILSALIAAFIGSYRGSMHAVRSYREQKAFDNQLDWYIRMLRSVRALNERIQSAFIWKDEGRDDPHWWSLVQIAHEEFERTAWEASLYGSKTARAAVDECFRKVRATQQASWTFDPYGMKTLPWSEESDLDAALKTAYKAMRDLPPDLDTSVRPIITEARKHLGLE
ncbi:hypothetical protein [Microvirga sp. BSC39]|uniref:hypothetical protein n=1 Tax=Microvirga sp. BSC39 TaxID=1549810 RepID=UPI0004E923E9|nr:hypothetical protein [Microvirga sp. BSC39]KFG68690.1 hypothetical protein JH26_14540 [Microvirga sp. BSC39]